MIPADISPRHKRVSRLLIPAALILVLAACHKAADVGGESSRGLTVEPYDAPIPKAPLKGKLDTMGPHPETAAAAAPASSGPVAASDLPPT